LLSKNMMSDLAPEVAKYPKGSPKPQNSQKMGILVTKRDEHEISLPL